MAEEMVPEASEMEESASTDTGHGPTYRIGLRHLPSGKRRNEAVTVDLNQESATAVFLISIYEFSHHPTIDKAKAILDTFDDKFTARYLKHTKRKMKQCSEALTRMEEIIQRREKDHVHHLDRKFFDPLLRKLFGHANHGFTVTALGDTDHLKLNSDKAIKIRNYLRKKLHSAFHNLSKLGLT